MHAVPRILLVLRRAPGPLPAGRLLPLCVARPDAVPRRDLFRRGGRSVQRNLRRVHSRLLLPRGLDGADALPGGHVVGGDGRGVERGVRGVRGGGARVGLRGGLNKRDADGLRGGLFLRGRRGGAGCVRAGDGVSYRRARCAARVLLERVDARGQRRGGHGERRRARGDV